MGCPPRNGFIQVSACSCVLCNNIVTCIHCTETRLNTAYCYSTTTEQILGHSNSGNYWWRSRCHCNFPLRKTNVTSNKQKTLNAKPFLLPGFRIKYIMINVSDIFNILLWYVKG